MKTCSLSQKWSNVATLPKLPSIDTFFVRQNSSMAKLQKELDKAGVAHYSGRAHVFISEPTPEQAETLQNRGVDVSCKRLFVCSPRR